MVKRILFFLVLLFSGLLSASGQQQYLLIGTYTHTGSKGIYVYSFNPETGALAWISNTDSIVNPSFLAVSKDKKFVYACTESRTPNAGSVSAFSFNLQTGQLTFINKQQAGVNPVYIALHDNGRWAVTANYTGGSISVFPVNTDGILQPFIQNIQLQGSSVNKDRQEGSHVHSAVFSPGSRFLYAPDLGTDKIMQYRFNTSAATPLLPLPAESVTVVPGSGPRHFTFHPKRKYAYLIEEMSGTITAYHFNPKKGGLNSFQRVATHAADHPGPFGSADIHISPDGRFLYASNRGTENNIAIFSINQVTGKLKLEGLQSSLGLHPRNFTMDVSGNYLLVANMQSDTVVVWKRDAQSGLLTPTGVTIKVPQPSCLQMISF